MDRSRFRDWVFDYNLIPWLEIIAHIAGHELHPDELAAVTHGVARTDSEADRWFDYQFGDLRLKVAHDVGTSVVAVDVDAPTALVPRVETATEIAKAYRLVERGAG